MWTLKRPLAVVALAALYCGLSIGSNAAGQTSNRLEVRTISLGIVSKVSQKEIEQHYHDFVGYLARNLAAGQNIEGKVVIAPTPANLAKLLEQQKVDFYMESAYATYVINDVEGAGKLLLRRWQRGKPEYQSLIFTKRNSGMNRLDDFRGKVMVFEDPESTSGYLLPKFFLLRHGFKLSEKGRFDAGVAPEEIGYVFAASQKKLVDLVLSQQVAGGAFSDDDYAKLEEKIRADISILAQTERLPRHLVSIRKDMPPELADRLRMILLAMSEEDEGRRILEKTGETTKFDMLPEGEEGMRRRLLETFFSPARR